jgi:hypothetical protein
MRSTRWVLLAFVLTASVAEAAHSVTVDPTGGRRPWIAESDQEAGRMGRSVGTAGDVNGDGYSDAIVGAYWYDDGQTDEGRAYVFHGSTSGLGATPDWTAEPDQAAAFLGGSVGTAGDVNGDGFDDVIVGVAYYDNGQTDEGRAHVYHGSLAGLSATPDWTAESDQANAVFGRSVATAGDVNGDGFDDVIVGAFTYDNGQRDEGRAFVYHGSPAGLSETPAWTAESDQASTSFGTSVGTAGDVNGDGYDDVIVGADRFDNGQTDEGRAFVYHGSPPGLSRTPAWLGEPDQASAHFAISVGTAGDVNRDGFADAVVGAYAFDNGQATEGGAFVYHGSPTGLSETPDWTGEGDHAGAWFGNSVGTAGDMDGDGFADVIVGAPIHDIGGRAFAYRGSAAGLSLTADWMTQANQVGARFGVYVGTAGDVDGDGFADRIVGAYGFDNGQVDEGRAYVWRGTARG